MRKKFSPSKNPCSDWKADKLINPRTGRVIKEHGPTYKKLERECQETQKIKLWAFKKFYFEAKPGSKTIKTFVEQIKQSDFIRVPLEKFSVKDIAEGLKKHCTDSKLNQKVAKLYLEYHKIIG